MANIWIDPVGGNNENRVGVVLKASHLLPSKSQSVKKQAFGELNNVMRNQQMLQGAATPFKSGAQAPLDVYPGLFSASKSKSLFNDVLRKQQAKQNFVQAQQKLENAFRSKGATPHKVAEKVLNREENLFDFWDLPSMCCTASCHKSDQEIWSDMNTIDDDILNKVLCGGDADTDDDDHADNRFSKDKEEHNLDDCDLSIMSSLQLFCPEAATNEECFINTLPLPTLSDFDDEDDDDLPF